MMTVFTRRKETSIGKITLKNFGKDNCILTNNEVDELKTNPDISHNRPCFQTLVDDFNENDIITTTTDAITTDKNNITNNNNLYDNVVNEKKKSNQIFRAKFFGNIYASKPRGDIECEKSMGFLKAQLMATKAHKKRIRIQLNADEICILGSKSSTKIHVHKLKNITFIWTDPLDARSCGIIVKQPLLGDNVHEFYGYKLDQNIGKLIGTLKLMFATLESEEMSKLTEDKLQSECENDSEPTEENVTFDLICLDLNELNSNSNGYKCFTDEQSKISNSPSLNNKQTNIYDWTIFDDITNKEDKGVSDSNQWANEFNTQSWNVKSNQNASDICWSNSAFISTQPNVTNDLKLNFQNVAFKPSESHSVQSNSWIDFNNHFVSPINPQKPRLFPQYQNDLQLPKNPFINLLKINHSGATLQTDYIKSNNSANLLLDNIFDIKMQELNK